MYLCIKILSVHLILCTNGTTKTECWVNPYLQKDLMLRYNGLSLSKNTQQSAGKLMPHIGCPCGVPPIQACLLKTECMELPWSQSLTLRMPYSYHNLSGRVPRLSPIILRDFWGLRAVPCTGQRIPGSIYKWMDWQDPSSETYGKLRFYMTPACGTAPAFGYHDGNQLTCSWTS